MIMIKITVTKFTANNWVANWVGQPTCSASGTTVKSAAENLLLRYNMVGIPAGIIALYDGNNATEYENPINITISKERLL
jgi:hypothetical protein